MHHAYGWICGISMRSPPKGKMWLGTVTVHDYTYVRDAGGMWQWSGSTYKRLLDNNRIILMQLSFTTGRLGQSHVTVASFPQSGGRLVPAGRLTWQAHADQVKTSPKETPSTAVKMEPWGAKERRTESIHQQRADSPTPADTRWLPTPRDISDLFMSAPFRSWINMSRTVPRAAQCRRATSPVPASLSEQSGRQAAARTACQACSCWLRVRPAISQAGLTEGRRALIGPSNLHSGQKVLECLRLFPPRPTHCTQFQRFHKFCFYSTYYYIFNILLGWFNLGLALLPHLRIHHLWPLVGGFAFLLWIGDLLVVVFI